MTSVPATISEVQLRQKYRDKKRAAIKGSMKLLLEADWFMKSAGILLSSVGMSCDHPMAANLEAAIEKLGEALVDVAELEALVDKQAPNA